jgi:hypothetical protein
MTTQQRSETERLAKTANGCLTVLVCLGLVVVGYFVLVILAHLTT